MQCWHIKVWQILNKLSFNMKLPSNNNFFIQFKFNFDSMYLGSICNYDEEIIKVPWKSLDFDQIHFRETILIFMQCLQTSYICACVLSTSAEQAFVDKLDLRLWTADYRQLVCFILKKESYHTRRESFQAEKIVRSYTMGFSGIKDRSCYGKRTNCALHAHSKL